MPGNSKHRTKIVCTLGPATDSVQSIEELLKAGMNIARVNLAHGTHAEHASRISNVREASRRLAVPSSIMIDLPGPKYRTGALKGDLAFLKDGSLITLTTDQLEGDSQRVSINLPTFPRDVKVGDTVLVDDGAIELKIERVHGSEVNCRVVAGGTLKPNRGVNVPGMRISSPFMTDQMQEHIAFATKQKPDYIALSFVEKPENVNQVREILSQEKSAVPIITKIERGQAVEKFDEILAVSDAIMVARGDLGVDMPLEKIPIIQKEIIKKCNKASKPVVTATQMLESMVSSIEPTRAEVTDIANAIFDGSDAIMLSAETAIGKYPVEAVGMMVRIALETEAHLPYDSYLMERSAWAERQTDELISYNACYTANRLGAAAIVAVTESGSTALRVAKYRPKSPILAITVNERVCGKLSLAWGVRPIVRPSFTSVMELFNTSTRFCKELGLAKPGDLIVITGGTPLGVPGTTSLLKVERVT